MQYFLQTKPKFGVRATTVVHSSPHTAKAILHVHQVENAFAKTGFLMVYCQVVNKIDCTDKQKLMRWGSQNKL
jgi:hypothetical protein